MVLAFIVIAVVIVVGFRACESRSEKRIEDRQPIIIEEQQGANQAINAAVNANAEAKDAQAAVNRVQRDRKANVSVAEANRNRCLAFPQSEGCK